MKNSRYRVYIRSVRGCHSAIVLLSGLAFLLLGCPSEPGDNDLDNSSPPQLVFRFATEVKPDNKVWEATRLIRRELEKASLEHNIKAGEIQVEFYDQGMIGTDRQVLEACYFGVVEMVLCTSSVATTIDPAFSLLDMPYLFRDEIHHKAVLDGPIGTELLDGLRQQRFKGLAFYSCGFRNMFYKRDPALPPIQGPNDLHGMKIRVMESPVMVASINALGASATPMPSSELFQALKTGVVDGAENNPRVFMADKYYEAGCNYFTWTEHFANQHVLIVNAAWFDGLEGRYKQRLCQVVRDIIPEYDQLWAQAVQEAVDQMQAYGVTVTYLDDKERFIRKVGDIHARFLQKNPSVPMDLYDRIKHTGE
ncbi:MAG: TRAP transporter substrate-binding protein [Phycisphaerales bacterium]|nr:MAG: TRAP transporter substrate-binding protein [Phycisphaerales bacterium]